MTDKEFTEYLRRNAKVYKKDIPEEIDLDYCSPHRLVYLIQIEDNLEIKRFLMDFYLQKFPSGFWSEKFKKELENGFVEKESVFETV